MDILPALDLSGEFSGDPSAEELIDSALFAAGIDEDHEQFESLKESYTEALLSEIEIAFNDRATAIIEKTAKELAEETR